MRLTLESAARTGALVEMRLRYDADGLAWIHRFCAEPLDEPQVEALLRPHGVRSVSWHGPARLWAVATMGGRS